MSNDTERRPANTQRRSSEDHELNVEMRAINERLVIAGVRQREHAQSAQEAERRSEETLVQLRAAHEGLHATHAHLQATLAEVQRAYEREHRIAQAPPASADAGGA